MPNFPCACCTQESCAYVSVDEIDGNNSPMASVVHRLPLSDMFGDDSRILFDQTEDFPESAIASELHTHRSSQTESAVASELYTHRSRKNADIDDGPTRGKLLDGEGVFVRPAISDAAIASAINRLGEPAVDKKIPSDVPVPVKPARFKVCVCRGTDDVRLGLDTKALLETSNSALKRYKGVLLISHIRDSGLIAMWNEAHRRRKVRAGDYIIEVNGVRGDPDDLYKIIAAEHYLDLVVLRTASGNKYTDTVN